MSEKFLYALVFLLTSTFPSFSQEYTAAKTKKMLTANEWELKYMLVDGKREELSSYFKGLRLVFMPSKNMIYEYQPQSDEIIYIHTGQIEAEHFKYQDLIEFPQMILDMEKLESGQLVFTDELAEGSRYYVYENAGPVKGKGFPSKKYEVKDPEKSMQTISPKVTELVASIQSELKKSAGNLYFQNKDKDRYLIKEVKFEPTEYGVKFSEMYDSKDSKGKYYSYEFDPEQIDEITDLKVDPASKVGQLRIKLNRESNFYYSNGIFKSIMKTVTIDYFKGSASAFVNLKKQLEDLSDYYAYGRSSRLEFFDKFLYKGQKLWLSVNGVSSNYQLLDYAVIANKIYLYYNRETVELSRTSQGSFLTIVPLKDISAITVENTNSNPKTFLLHNKRKGFTTYVYEKEKYQEAEAVKMVPLFTDSQFDNHRIQTTLRQLIQEDGGDKLKVVYNP